MNCRNLIKLYLSSLRSNDDAIGNELLDILIKFSPKSLTNITLSGNWWYSIDAFENFFESYRERKSLYFGIDEKIGKSTITSQHINLVKKYYKEGIIKRSYHIDSWGSYLELTL